MINRPENVFSYMFTILLVLQAAILLFWASSYPLASAYEGEIIMAAGNMLQSGGWFLPNLESQHLVFHTPILPYWLSATGKVFFSWNLLGFRIFSVMVYLLASWGFFRSVRNYLDARTAFYSSAILACCLPFLWQMQLATPDGLAAILISTSLFSFYLFLKTNKKKFFWVLYGSMAAGILVKGLLGLLIPLLIMAVYLMFKIKMNETTLNKLRVGKGILLIALISFPWYLYAGIEHDGLWLKTFLDEYHWQRYFEENAQAKGSFFSPFLFIILMTLPFGIFLPKSFSFGWKLRFKKDLLLLSGLSLFLILLFFAFSGTFYPHYLLPAFPFAAILIANRFSTVAGRSLFKMRMNIEIGLLVLLSLLLPILIWNLLQDEVQEGSGGTFIFGLLLATLPLGTILSLTFWANKRTDEGLSLLIFSYLLFFVLLIHYGNLSTQLGAYLQYLIY